MLSGSGVAMLTDPGPFRVSNLCRRDECGLVREQKPAQAGRCSLALRR
jgi:hypothetical protein